MWTIHIHLWDVATGAELRTFSGGVFGKNDVASLAFNSNGALLVARSTDKTIKFWSTAHGTELLTLTGDTDFVTTGVAFSPDERLLASAGADTAIKLWSMETGKELGSYPGRNSVSFSPDGRLAGDRGDPVTVWKIMRGK